MYAVIRSGGKQHRVEPGKTFKVEKLVAEVGSKIELTDVLMVADDGKVTLGDPIVASATVRATVTAQDRAKKIRVFKMKRKKQYRRTNGHRQDFTELRVDEIKL
jgi:large subunit ribosomal protein L21